MPRNKINIINGWINIFKTEGITSNDIIRDLKKIFKDHKIGHAGTLDPMATGVLPIAIGEATKTVPYIHKKDKTYKFNIKFGVSTDSDDSMGKIIETSNNIPNINDVTQFLLTYTGYINQVPPIYSAKKINGVRAYALARAGAKPDMVKKSKIIHIDKFELIEKISETEYSFIVRCGTGTYIRSISKDMSLSLNCCCHVTKIERTIYGPFNLENILSIDRLIQQNHDIDKLIKIVEPIETVLDDILAVKVNNHEASKLKNGMSINKTIDSEFPFSGEVYATCGEKIVAICKYANGQIQPQKVFNLQ